MKTEENVPVCSKGVVVDNINIDQFDTVEEAVELLGVQTVVGLINVQYKTNLMNQARQKATAKSNPKITNKNVAALLEKMPIERIAELRTIVTENNAEAFATLLTEFGL